MSLHKTVVELTDKVRELTDELSNERRLAVKKWREMEWELHKLKETQAFEIEKAKYGIRKEMEKSLIESDIARTEAVAKLNTYIDMDTKDERKHIQKMLEEAIKSLGAQKTIVNSK